MSDRLLCATSVAQRPARWRTQYESKAFPLIASKDQDGALIITFAPSAKQLAGVAFGSPLRTGALVISR